MKSLLLSLRNLAKSPATQAVKIVSLTLGLAAGLLIFAKVAFERSYDNFFPDSGRVYQAKVIFPIDNGAGSPDEESDMLYGAMAPYMMENLPAVESATRTYWNWGREYFHDDGFFNFRTILADTCLFDVLDYGMVQGDPKSLRDPDAALISESAAKVLFGDGDPVGQTLQLDKKIPLTIRGVFRDVPANSQVDFDVILSIHGMGGLVGWGGNGFDWDTGDSFRIYLKLHPGASIAEVESAVGPLMQRSPIAEMIDEFSIRFLFRPIDQSYQYDPGNRQINGLMLTLAFLVLFISAMNYVLVSISSLDRRTKAIAVQKCNGAGQGTIFGQFLIETAMLILLSLGLAVFLFFAFRQQIQSLTGETLATLFVPRQWVRIGAVVSGFFLLAGVIPGRIFSHIPVAHAFKTIPADKRWWKQTLLFLQLLCATFVLIFLIIVVRQYNLVANRPMGYVYENVVSTPIKNTTSVGYERIRQQLSTLPFVENIVLASADLTAGLSGEVIKIPGTEENISARRMSVEAGFPELMGIPLRYGAYFSPAPFQPYQALVNEKLVEMMGWDSDPVGKYVREFPGTPGIEITGVLRDFHIGGTASTLVMPIIIYPMERRDTAAVKFTFGGDLHIRLTKLNADNLAGLRSALEELLPDQQVTINAYTDMVRRTASGERMIRNLVSIAAVIIFLITLTGLIGYVNDEVRRRRREIGIRKVHGATVANVITIIARSLLVAGAAALIAGTAGAWVAASAFVRDFPVHISLSAWSFIAGAGLVLAVCTTTIILRARRAATENPVNAIKTE